MRNRLREWVVNLFVKNAKDFKRLGAKASERYEVKKDYYTTPEMIAILIKDPSVQFEGEMERPINLSGDTSVMCVNKGGTIRTYPSSVGIPSLRWRIANEE